MTSPITSNATPRFSTAIPYSAPLAARPVNRHSLAVRLMHWTTVLAMLAATAAALLRDALESPALRSLLMDIHRQAGLWVLLALVLRLAVRVGRGMADHAGATSPLLRITGLMAHLALYAMLLALPVLGWAVCNAHEVGVKLLGVIALPALVAPDADLADNLTDWHVIAAWAMLALVVLHVAAALWHHFIRRDGVLLAMLPNSRLRD